MNQPSPPSRPRIRVPLHGRQAPAAPRPAWLLPAAWVLSLVVVAALVAWVAGPGAGDPAAQLRQREGELAQATARMQELEQRLATLQASDRISRAANAEVQASLAERDEEIAGLRAEVAFYERLVGATAQRKGLSAHSVEFSAEAGGTWHYAVVLTQNLNRGAISTGQMRFSVQGVLDGKLTTVSWDELHQRKGTPGQEYSFRYFQQLDGSVMLPKDFTPQRVRVSLSGTGASAAQDFEWKIAGSGKGE